MIAHVLLLTRWEWYKLRHRWMPWVILVILVAVTHLILWAMSAGGGPDQRFAPPGSIVNGLDIVTTTFGAVLVMILASSATGVEYGWGTLRAVLTRGVGRWQLLASKMLMLMLASAAGLLILSALILVSSLAASAFGDAQSQDAGQWSDAAIALGKSVYSLVPYVILVTFFVVLTSSAAVGSGIALGYYVGELIIVGILNGVIDGFERISRFVLGPSVAAWMGGPLGTTGSSLGHLQASLVMLAYIAVIAAAAFWIFQRKDVTGPRGA